MTPLSGITQKDVDIATAIEEAAGKNLTIGFPEKLYAMIDSLTTKDILRALGVHAAQDPEFRARYIQAAKDAGLIP